MKKKLLFIISVSLISVISLGVILFMNKNKQADDKIQISDNISVEKIAEDYANLRERIENNHEENNDDETDQKKVIARDYAQLCDNISKGDTASSKEYARLLREITHNTYDFNDNEVFIVAEYLAILYTKMSDGLECGIQQIKIVERKSGEMALCIEYDKYGVDKCSYSVKILGEDEMATFQEMQVNKNEIIALGKNRIQIMFHNVYGVPPLANKYPARTTHIFNEVPQMLKNKINIRTSFPDDSTFALFIGSDEPINIKNQGMTKIDPAKGIIEIPIG